MKYASLLLSAAPLACGCVACAWTFACLIGALGLAIVVFIVWSFLAELRLLASTLPRRWGGPG